jgi:hypothetical protein
MLRTLASKPVTPLDAAGGRGPAAGPAARGVRATIGDVFWVQRTGVEVQIDTGPAGTPPFTA